MVKIKNQWVTSKSVINRQDNAISMQASILPGNRSLNLTCNEAASSTRLVKRSYKCSLPLFYHCTGTYMPERATAIHDPSRVPVTAVIHHALLRLFNGSQPLLISVDRKVGIFN